MKYIYFSLQLQKKYLLSKMTGNLWDMFVLLAVKEDSNYDIRAVSWKNFSRQGENSVPLISSLRRINAEINFKFIIAHYCFFRYLLK